MWVHRCNRSIYTIPRSWAHSRCSAALDEFNHGPTVNYLQLFPAVPIGPFIYLGSSIHGPTHDICPLLLDGPMWFHRYNRSIYAMPRLWAHSRCSAALDEFNHGPTVNYLQLFPAVPIGPFIYLGSSIHGPTHDICPLLLDGPMWVHRYDRSIYTMPRSWAYSRCSAALDEFNHGPTVNY